ncbi:MAG TPA: hypothetical protein VMS76_02915 [Planctomycetota bacterium]|nr:hypothetical protein [Planctomycetota bacterium]
MTRPSVKKVNSMRALRVRWYKGHWICRGWSEWLVYFEGPRGGERLVGTFKTLAAAKAAASKPKGRP